MDAKTTLFWHDYETSGADKRRDRPLQFAGIRTDENLTIIDEPVMFYCRPALDALPKPEAAMITGLTPQTCQRLGVNEATFAERVIKQLGQPGTCGVGYNSIRFDDEITRNLLYRNFHDPYEREWMGGNSRWDLIDMVRMMYALRPQGMQWPLKPDGTPSFRLEDLASANDLSQQRAHDALSDVYSSIDLARLLKRMQPAMFGYHFDMRRKARVAELVNPVVGTPVLHSSAYYPASKGCLSVVVPLLTHPQQKNAIIAWDAAHDPSELFEMDQSTLTKRWFGKPDGDGDKGDFQRFGLRIIHLNRSPAVAPLQALGGVDLDRIGLDLTACRHHARKIMPDNDRGLRARLASVLNDPALAPAPPDDPDLAIYGGGFASHKDKGLMKRVRAMPTRAVVDLVDSEPFEDGRYNEMLFRYVARNWPEALTGAQRQRWEQLCEARLLRGEAGSPLTLAAYREGVQHLMAAGVTDEQRAALVELAQWGEEIGRMFEPDQPIARPMVADAPAFALAG